MHGLLHGEQILYIAQAVRDKLFAVEKQVSELEMELVHVMNVGPSVGTDRFR